MPFLCHRVIPFIEERTGVRFDYVPVLLGGIFKATGNESPATKFRSVRNKPEYLQLEIERFHQTTSDRWLQLFALIFP